MCWSRLWAEHKGEAIVNFCIGSHTPCFSLDSTSGSGLLSFMIGLCSMIGLRYNGWIFSRIGAIYDWPIYRIALFYCTVIQYMFGKILGWSICRFGLSRKRSYYIYVISMNGPVVTDFFYNTYNTRCRGTGTGTIYCGTKVFLLLYWISRYMYKILHVLYEDSDCPCLIVDKHCKYTPQIAINISQILSNP